MTDTAIYGRQSFGQKTGLGRSPALLLVDFVNGFNDPDILGGGNIDAAVKATVPLLAHARSRGLPVVFTRIVYAEDGSDTGLWCEKVPRLRDLTETAAASQVVPELSTRPGELVIRKTQASAFFDTGLAAQLAWRGIDSLVGMHDERLRSRQRHRRDEPQPSHRRRVRLRRRPGHRPTCRRSAVDRPSIHSFFLAPDLADLDLP